MSLHVALQTRENVPQTTMCLRVTVICHIFPSDMKPLSGQSFHSLFPLSLYFASDCPNSLALLSPSLSASPFPFTHTLAIPGTISK